MPRLPAILASLALAGALLATPAAASVHTLTTPAPWDVEVVQTTANLSERLTRLRDLAFTPASAWCTGRQLKLTAAPRHTFRGQYEQTVVIANISPRPCVIRGYPHLELFGARGRVLAASVRPGSSTLFTDLGPFLVVLGQRASASFAFGGVIGPPRCPHATRVELALPHSSGVLGLRSRAPACGSVIHITALGPGPDSVNPASSRRVVAVDPRLRYQRVTGVGAAMTDTSAWLLYDELPAPASTRLIGELFGPSGIHLSSVMVPMGASDFTRTGQPYTYDDLPPGQTDPGLAGFSIAHDQAYILPALRQMLGVNPQTKVFAAPWSAPAWMKANDALNDAGLLGTPLAVDYRPLAEYFVKFIEAYAGQGIPIAAIIPANEPSSAALYPAMSFPAPMEAQWIAGYLEPALAAAGLHPQIYGYDAGWESGAYARQLISSAAAPDLSGIAWHCYSGTPQIMGAVHRVAPALDEAVTECSPGVTQLSISAAVIGAFRNWASTVMLWNLALDPSGGPVQPPDSGCAGCTGLVTIDEADGVATPRLSYYQLGQVGRFVEPGAWRIASRSFVTYSEQLLPSPAQRVTPGLDDVAFENPDGSEVLIAYNTSAADIPFAVAWRGRWLTYVLAPRATVSFTWNR